MKILFVSLFTIFSLASFAQNEVVMSDPNVRQRTLNESFTAINVSDGVTLYLTQGNEEQIAISTSDAKYEERFKTTVKNGVLKIWYDNQGVNWPGNDKKKLKAYVSFKTLEKLAASAGAHVIMKSILSSDKMDCTFSSGARFTGQVAIDELDVSQSSGAQVEISGNADHLKVDVSSGAMFKGYELATDFCEAKASSGGAARVTVNKELVVKANSGGGIQYKGDGVIKDMNINSGGSVKKG